MQFIDLQSRVPIYRQIYDNIRNRILDGEIHHDEKLPSVRELSKELGVNPNTVTKAMQELERDGVIYTVQGRGSYASKPVTEKLRKEAYDGFDSSVKGCFRAGITAGELTDRISVLADEQSRDI